MNTRNLKLYHWFLLGLSASGLAVMGLLDLIAGASQESRFYAVDNVLVRLIGGGLILSSVGLVLRRGWGFVASFCFLGISIVEVVATDRSEPSLGSNGVLALAFNAGAAAVFLGAPVAIGVIALALNAGAVAFLFGVPIAILSWLRCVVASTRAEPCTSPKGGPATPQANSEVPEGPPSVT
jgi:hypothetical protein